MKPGQVCENCGAYAPLTKECRLKSPTPSLLMEGNQIKIIGLFPATKPENWCREWLPEDVVLQ